jgi:hypothetical protein
VRGIAIDTLIEMVDRKIIWLFVGAIVLGLLGVLISTGVQGQLQFDTTGGYDSGDFGDVFSDPILRIFHGFGSFLLFLAVFSCVGLVPRMLAPGRAEFYLSKPISHQSLLLYKMTSTFVVYGGLVFGSGFIVYVFFAAVFGTFDWSVVVMFLFFLVPFAFWLTIIVFFGLLSGSTVMAVIAAFAFWMAEKVIAFRDIFKELIDVKAGDVAVDIVYYALPKCTASSNILRTLASQNEVSDWTPLWTTALFSAVMLYLSLWLIRRKDF